MGAPHYSDSDLTPKTAAGRVIRMRSEITNDNDELVIEENGEKRTVSVSCYSNGVVIGCTRLSWHAYDYIVREIQRKR
jgi:hypothetical protein